MSSNFEHKKLGSDSLNPPYQSCDQTDGCKKIPCQSVIAREDPAEVIEPVEGTFDFIFGFIDGFIERERLYLLLFVVAHVFVPPCTENHYPAIISRVLLDPNPRYFSTSLYFLFWITKGLITSNCLAVMGINSLASSKARGNNLSTFGLFCRLTAQKRQF